MYKSRQGFWVMGDKPMFDDVEENVGAAIKAKILEVFGFFPILDLSEKWESWYEGDEEVTVWRDYGAVLDLELIDQIGDFEIGYVTRLLEKVILRRLEDPTVMQMDLEASKKYCFSDTEDWWDAMKVSTFPEGRQRFTLHVELG